MYVDAAVFNESWMSLIPPQALVEVKPKSYYPKVLAIGPLYQNLGPSPIDNCKALCVNKFMERHGVSMVEDLIQDLTSHEQDELSLPQFAFGWFQLLVIVDS